MATMETRTSTVHAAIGSVVGQLDRLYVFLDRFTREVTFSSPRVTTCDASIYGDIRGNGKFLALTQESNGHYFFGLDDDIIYPGDYVRRMIERLETLPQPCVLGVHGALLNDCIHDYVHDRTVFHFRRNLDRCIEVDIVGTGTCVFRTDGFTFDAAQWVHTNMSDLQLALECQRKGVRRYVIERSPGWLESVARGQRQNIYSSLKEDCSVQTSLAKKIAALSTRNSPEPSVE